MTDTFDPGPGWREVSVDESRSTESVRYASRETMRYWVREVPVLPLPTVPWTTISVTSSRFGSAEEITLHPDGLWWPVRGEVSYDERDLARITGFEVLAAPHEYVPDLVRRQIESDASEVTAKALLERIASEPWAREVDLAKWRREFGVES